MNGKIQEQSADYNQADLKPFLEKTPDNNTLLDSLPVWLSAQTTKSAGRGRSAENTHQYGVQKLRELILELAVRGKLVEQDPNDEPASILLEKIAGEKSRLIKEGKIKKQKPTQRITDKELIQIPPGWELVRLQQICLLENGDRSKNYPNKSMLVESGIPFVNAGHLRNGKVDWSEMTYVTEERFELLKAGKFESGDILFCLRGSLGKSAIIEGFDTGAIASSLVILRLLDGLHRYYFHNYFNSPLSESMIRQYDNGTAQPNLSAADLAKFVVPLPPLAEQHRIVKKVDELMALCDQLEQQQTDTVQAHDTLVKVLLDTLTQSDNAEDFQQNWRRIAEHFDTLFTTESSIDQLKQTLLQLAVMGKLVRQDPNDEPADVLLEKITETKARLVKEGKIKKQKAQSGISDDEIPFLIPSSWTWGRLGSIGFTQTGGTPSKSNKAFFGSDIPFIKPADIYANKVDYYNEGLTIKGAESLARIAPKGSILMVCIGTIGKCNSVDRDVCFNQQINSITPYKCDSQFLLSALRSYQFQSEAWARSSSTTIAILNKGKWESIPIPIPPLLEQHRIVKKVDELMALCNQLKDRFNQAQTLQQQLADAVVETAITED